MSSSRAKGLNLK